VSISPPPPPGYQNVEISYTYSIDLDLGVVNWDDGHGNFLYRNVSTVSVPSTAQAVSALRVAPNPMSARAAIRYHGEGIENARLAIVDVTGRRVRILHDGPLSAGLVTWEWDRRGSGGDRVADGVYFVEFRAAGLATTRRLVVLK